MSKTLKAEMLKDERGQSQPAYIMDLEDIVRMRDLEVRAHKERIAELEVKVASLGDAALLAERWRAVAMGLMEIADGRWREVSR